MPGLLEREVISDKLFKHFPGKIVRGSYKRNKGRGQCPCICAGISFRMYCSSQDESAIEQGSKTLRIF